MESAAGALRPQEPGSGDTALHMAARKGDAQLVATLLAAAKKPYSRNAGREPARPNAKRTHVRASGRLRSH
jgi:ankyrin repeat protein